MKGNDRHGLDRCRPSADGLTSFPSSGTDPEGFEPSTAGLEIRCPILRPIAPCGAFTRVLSSFLWHQPALVADSLVCRRVFLLTISSIVTTATATARAIPMKKRVGSSPKIVDGFTTRSTNALAVLPSLSVTDTVTLNVPADIGRQGSVEVVDETHRGVSPE